MASLFCTALGQGITAATAAATTGAAKATAAAFTSASAAR